MSEPADLLQQARRPSQNEMPFAVVQGTPVNEPPKDLYIPPEALEVFLEAFEGPLDLLLYLIRRQKSQYSRYSNRPHHRTIHVVHRHDGRD